MEHSSAGDATPPRRSRRPRRGAVAVIAVIIIFASGLLLGGAVERVAFEPGNATALESATFPPAIQEAWTLIHDHYVDSAAIDDQKLTSAAITGMLGTLGDEGHTRYLSPEEVAAHQESLSGSYVGVGIQVEQRDGKIVVVAPLDGSPAQRAGIRSGDVLLRVNGQDVSGMELDPVIGLIRGPSGTAVSLTFSRPGEASPIEVTLVRTEIKVSAAVWALLPGTSVADIRLRQFSSGAAAELRTAVQQAEEAGATAIVLDLRNNPGGLVDEAIAVASLFLPPDTPVFISQVRGGEQVVHYTQAADDRTNLPLTVLINQGTASAAEIVAGALQENGRATLVGETTFGTGTVLNQFGLSDGSAILLGTELWLTPDGDQIRDRGIVPDARVATTTTFAPSTSDHAPAAMPDDAQLQYALRVLRGDPLPNAPATGRCSQCR